MYRYDQTGSTTTTGTKFRFDDASMYELITRDHNNMWIWWYDLDIENRYR
jgi:hypothetical protein